MLLPCLADVVAILVADVIATFCCWQMLLPYLADVIAIIFCLLMVPCLADVIAILWLMLLPLFIVGRCCCHVWLMLLPLFFCLLMAPVVLLWLLLCHIVGVLYFFGRSYCQVWLMLLPFDAVWQMLLPIWLMLLPFISCCVRQMLFARVADGIAYPDGCGSDVMTMCGRWNSH